MSTIPDPNWSQQDTSGGYEPPKPATSGQAFGCYICASELNLDAPDPVYLIGGTSVCVNHISNMFGGQK